MQATTTSRPLGRSSHAILHSFATTVVASLGTLARAAARPGAMTADRRAARDRSVDETITHWGNRIVRHW